MAADSEDSYVDVQLLYPQIILQYVRPASRSSVFQNDAPIDYSMKKNSDLFKRKPSDTSESLPCRFCAKLYKNITTLLYHIRNKHPEDGVEVQCGICFKVYSSSLSLRKHEQYMHMSGHRCRICYKSFETGQLFEDHRKNCFQIASPCPDCSKSFKSKRSLNDHLKYKHTIARENWCELCHKSFKSERSLKNHAWTVHPEGQCQCKECHKVFSSVARLRSHIWFKHGKMMRRYKCILCKTEFSNTSMLLQHTFSVHRDAAKNCTNNGN